MKYLDLKPEAKKHAIELLENEFDFYTWKARKLDGLAAGVLSNNGITKDDDGLMWFNLYGVKQFHVQCDWSFVFVYVKMFDRSYMNYDILVETEWNATHTKPEVRIDVKSCTAWFATNELRDIILAQERIVEEIHYCVRNFDFVNEYCEENDLDFTETGCFRMEREELKKLQEEVCDIEI